MSMDDDLRLLLRQHAARAPDADLVRTRIDTAIRHRQRRRSVAVTVVTAAGVAGLVLGAVALGPPSATPPTPVAGKPAEVGEVGEDISPSDAQDAFYRLGYDEKDARTLADLWDIADPEEALIKAGRRITESAALPEAFYAYPAESADEARAAFTGAGYTTDDAAVLADLWNRDDVTDATALAGLRIIKGRTLPELPSDTAKADDTAGDTAKADDQLETLEEAIGSLLDAGFTWDDIFAA